MAFIVQKFGGTSVADADSRERMFRKIEAARERGDRLVVVVSAMGRKGAPYATDSLLGLLASAAEGAEPSGIASDLIASCGETISACLVATMLSARGIKAVPLTAYSAGIRASGPYGDADVTDVDAERIMAVIDSGSVPVVTGFQAVSPNGGIVTIGRGGSDTSAVAIGAFVKADFVDIYTDVPGVAMADPRLVPDAPFLKRLDYGSMYRLSSNGARVLHDRSAILGERFGVRIRIRSTFDEGEGTLVSDGLLPSDAPALLGVAVDKDGDTARVTVVCREGQGQRLAERASSAASAAGASPADPRSLPADPDAFAFLCPAEAAPALTKALLTALRA